MILLLPTLCLPSRICRLFTGECKCDGLLLISQSIIIHKSEWQTIAGATGVTAMLVWCKQNGEVAL